MEVVYFDSSDRELVDELVGKLVEKVGDVGEVIGFIKRVDSEASDRFRDAVVSMSIHLGTAEDRFHTYEYFAEVFEDCIEIYAYEYTHSELQDGVKRRIHLATIYP